MSKEQIRQENLRIMMIWILQQNILVDTTEIVVLAEIVYDFLAGKIAGTYFVRDGQVFKRFADCVDCQDLLNYMATLEQEEE